VTLGDDDELDSNCIVDSDDDYTDNSSDFKLSNGPARLTMSPCHLDPAMQMPDFGNACRPTPLDLLTPLFSSAQVNSGVVLNEVY
jgi:hypothetical protein